MKKVTGKFFLILLTALTLGLSSCGLQQPNQPEGPSETEVALQTAKDNAKAQVDAWDLSVYRDAEKATLQLAIATFRSELDASTTEAEVAAALQKLLDVKNGLKTAAQYEAEEAEAARVELEGKKTAAKTELEGYPVATDYDEEHWTQVQAAINEGKGAIDDATSIAGVNAALAEAKAAIDKIKKKPTADELALMAAKEEAKQTVNAWNVNLYRDAEKASLEAAIATFNTELEAATTVSEVTNALNKVIAVKNGLKTASAYEEEEAAARALALAKTNAKAALDGYATEDDYLPTEWAQVQAMITAGKASIDAATDTAAVNTALLNAKTAIDNIGKKPVVPAEVTILETLAGLSNFTVETHTEDNQTKMHYISTMKFTGSKFSASSTGEGEQEFAYSYLLTQMHLTDIEAAKVAFNANVKQMEAYYDNIYKYDVTYDDANEKVILKTTYIAPYATYADYNQEAKQFYFFLYNTDTKEAEEYRYMLEQEASVIQGSYFALNAKVLSKLVTAENYDSETDSYKLQENATIYMVVGDELSSLKARNFEFKFENNMPKEFTFEGMNGFGGKYETMRNVFSSFGTTVVDVPQVTLSECDHKYCEVCHEDLGARGHRDYCCHCHKYLGDIENHNYDSKYHVCKECLHIDAKEQYINENYFTLDGVPYATFMKTADNQIIMDGNFSEIGDHNGIINGYDFRMQYVIEEETNRVALIKYGANEKLEGETCLYAQPNEIRVYSFDFKDLVAELAERYSAENIYTTSYEYNEQTEKYETVINYDKPNYYNVIYVLYTGFYNKDLTEFDYFEENATKLSEDTFISLYFAHNLNSKTDTTDPCHPIEYRQCALCDGYVDYPDYAEAHDWSGEYKVVATPSGYEGNIFIERECGRCHEKQVIYASAKSLANHDSEYVNATYFTGKNKGASTTMEIPHIYGEDHICALCGAKEVEGISINSEYIKASYENDYESVDIPEITVNYKDGSQEVVPSRNENSDNNYRLYLVNGEDKKEIYDGFQVHAEEMIGECKLVVDFDGFEVSYDVTITAYQEELYNIEYRGSNQTPFVNQNFDMIFAFYGKLDKAEIEFYDEDGNKLENINVVEESIDQENGFYIATVNSSYQGFVYAEITGYGPHNSIRNESAHFPICELVNVDPIDKNELVFDHIRGKNDLNVKIGNYSYRTKEGEDPVMDMLSLDEFIDYEEIDKLDDGENIINIDVYGTALEITVNVKSVESVEAILVGENANKTEYAYEDKSIETPVQVLVTYSDDSFEVVNADSVYLTDPNEEEPDDPWMPRPDYDICWSHSGTWTVNYSYLGEGGSYDITVAERIPVGVTGVNISGAGKVLVGEEYRYDLGLEPDNCSLSEDIVSVEWTTTTPELISIDEREGGCHVSALALGEADLTVTVVDFDGHEETKTITIKVVNTLFPTEEYEAYFGEGYVAPELNCTALWMVEEQTDYLRVIGNFPDLIKQLESLNWDLMTDENDEVCGAISPDNKMILNIMADYGDDDYQLVFMSKLVNDNLVDMHTVQEFTYGFLNDKGIGYNDAYMTVVGENCDVRAMIIVLEVPGDIEPDQISNYEEFLAGLVGGLEITGAVQDEQYKYTTDSAIGYQYIYNNLEICVYVQYQNDNSIVAYYIYSYVMPNCQVNP